MSVEYSGIEGIRSVTCGCGVLLCFGRVGAGPSVGMARSSCLAPISVPIDAFCFVMFVNGYRWRAVHAAM